MGHTVEQVEVQHLGRDRARLVLNADGIEVAADLHPDQVDDLLIECQDATDKTEAFLTAQHKNPSAEQAWRQ